MNLMFYKRYQLQLCSGTPYKKPLSEIQRTQTVFSFKYYDSVPKLLLRGLYTDTIKSFITR